MRIKHSKNDKIPSFQHKIQNLNDKINNKDGDVLKFYAPLKDDKLCFKLMNRNHDKLN